ncbi:NAD(P)H-dependent oxidoreductase subunit E [Terrisporobacter vanillatitrophus]|uniref:NADH-quinone oxidoreductase subunit NuoE family protein n=1 Tax=Terrisporobacter vanillatitrophus TaxID=3058402 RepID=UPI003368B9D5
MHNFITKNKNLFNELDNIINNLPIADQSSLIYILQEAQNIFGHLPKEVQLYISKKLNIAPVEIYGVVTFYDCFSLTPTF